MLRYILKNKMLCVAYVFTAAIAGIFGICFAFVLSEFVDRAAMGELNNFWSYSACTILFVVITVIAEFACGYTKLKIIKESKRNLKQDLFEKIIRQNLQNYEKRNSAEYINYLTTKIDMYEDSFLNTVLTIPVILFSFLFSVIATASINVIMLFLILFMGVVMVVATKCVSKILEKSSKEYVDEVNRHTGFIKDVFFGIRLIKNHNLEERISNRYIDKNQQVENKKNVHKVNMILCSSVGSFVGILGTVIVCMIASYLSIKQFVSPGEILALSQLAGKVMSPLMSVSGIMISLKSAKVLTKEFSQILNVEDKKIKKQSLEDGAPVLRTEGLSFKYVSDNFCLRDINLEFRPGKRYCFVGPSGSGKSTLFMLLQGLYEGYEGKIYINESEYHEIASETICDTIGFVTQETFIFDDSIRNNITLYGDYEQEKIDKAIDMAGLREYIDSLPLGLETPILESGKNMSGGQKTRLNIARILLRRYPIVLLDEYTSSLDNEVSYEIEKNILENLDSTVIAISHKLTKGILENYDEIYVMQDGIIVESGSFDNLMQMKRKFFSLYMLS